MKASIFNCYLALILIPVIFLSSCTQKPNEKGEYVIKPNKTSKEVHIKYTNNGNIDYIQEYGDGTPSGVFLNFKKGNIKDISTIKNDKGNGCGVVFHNNGMLNNFGQYVNGQKTGWFYVFDKNGDLSGKREYVAVNGKEYLNQWVDYKPDGSIERFTSNYIVVTPVKDTIALNEEYKLNISLEAAFFKQYMVLVTGPFDPNYNLPAGASCDTIKSKDFAAVYKTKGIKKGKNTLRGMVLDLRPDANDPKKISIRKIYFSHEYRVR